MVCGGDADRSIKLLRLYDAALARAEKAERNMNAIGESWRLPCERAESRLAEATALLEQVEDCYADNEEAEQLVSAVHAFLRPCDHSGIGMPECTLCDPRLSATPAQAAEPEDLDLGDAIIAACKAVHEPRSLLTRVYNAIGLHIGHAPAGAEHPDTIALRECRAELERKDSAWMSEVKAHQESATRWGKRAERLHGDVESARAERDTALEKRHEAIQEQARLADGCNAALARIAELTEHNVQQGVRYEFRIARAVAELENEALQPSARIKRALEALR